jgi:mono/diheme cytochrome c family protein
MIRPLLAALAASFAVCAPVRPLQAQTSDSAAILVQRGKQLFEGRGLCFSCHGLKGEGLLGPDTRLAGRKLRYSKPELASLISLIKSGVDSTRSQSKLLMPPMGGARLSDPEVRSLASYVLELLKRDSLP